mmetsp:Transcript_1392/g.5628  ORF Transcript_1392/g.5628 Transcript_1392/m.5628 type:complete len:345 (-) Transcript_1392:64-1098(-)
MALSNFSRFGRADGHPILFCKSSKTRVTPHGRPAEAARLQFHATCSQDAPSSVPHHGHANNKDGCSAGGASRRATWLSQITLQRSGLITAPTITSIPCADVVDQLLAKEHLFSSYSTSLQHRASMRPLVTHLVYMLRRQPSRTMCSIFLSSLHHAASSRHKANTKSPCRHFQGPSSTQPSTFMARCSGAHHPVRLHPPGCPRCVARRLAACIARANTMNLKSTECPRMMRRRCASPLPPPLSSASRRKSRSAGATSAKLGCRAVHPHVPIGSATAAANRSRRLRDAGMKEHFRNTSSVRRKRPISSSSMRLPVAGARSMPNILKRVLTLAAGTPAFVSCRRRRS